MIENYLVYGLNHAKINPKQWTVVPRLWKSPNRANVLRSSDRGNFSLRMSTVDKESGKVLSTEHSYRNAEVLQNGNQYYIQHTCNADGKVEKLTVELNSLPEVRAYFKEMLPKYVSEQYKPIR